MTWEFDGNPAPYGAAGPKQIQFDPTKPSPARVYDYVLGGKDNFAADRAAADQVLQVFPEGRELAWANRRFMARAVRFCLGQIGHVGQIVDIGTGMPTSPNVAQVAREVNPEAVVVGVDNDPVVLAHGRALVDGEGVRIVPGDVREPERIISDLSGIVDWSRPVALVFVAVLHFVSDEDDPHRILAAFRKALTPGSLLVISHVTKDGVSKATVDRIDQVYGNAPVPLILRTTEQIKDLFTGSDLLDPGLVDVHQWRPDDRFERRIDLRILGGVSRIP
ncbi:SAM-dependent methyltransferase [Planotetraspora sp. A-T 1434]|uniref:SAM-dependent methyltransferase n=1 Tax=Planotetraspora sp. A-T 1434 TaxID=2979219 RepID=UPI0021BF839D|nr:SAM-dependent methyltransferase [Planotetraspora sp. A-T 1434]MCT9933708.1 SAM-dependent methyltransferase [Planotetraspora sp. A-T 1434]